MAPVRFLLTVAALLGAIHAPCVAAADGGHRRLEGPAVRSFFDRTIPQELERSGAPGGVVAVVRQGKVLHLEGYGLADPAAGEAMDPEITPLAVGSISESMTAVAVLQLEESGRIRLADDVAGDLDFPLRGEFAEPVTFEQLLTHTAGFEERTLGRRARAAAGLRPLGEYLAERLPARVRPPGVVSADSSHGYALAGYLAERVAGIPFELYMRENVFKPLGMARSSFDPQPLPGTEPPRGFTCQGERARAVPREFLQTRPASMAVTTAADMVRFMMALLNGGANPSGRALERASARRMLTPQFSYHPEIPVESYGLSAGSRRAPRRVFRAGGVGGFHSALVLAPEEDLGLFVSVNCGASVWPSVNGFFEEFFPAEAREAVSGSGAPEPAAEVGGWAGVYREAEGAYTTLEKIASLFGQRRVEAAGPGVLSVFGRRYLARGDGLFEEESGGAWLLFRARAGTTYLLGAVAYERVPWWERAGFQGGWMAVTLGLFLSALGAWRRAARRDGGGKPLAARAWRWAGGAATFHLLFVAGLAMALAGSPADGGSLVFGAPWTLRVLLAMPFVGMALTAGCLVHGCGLVARHAPGRFHYGLVTLALLAFPLWLGCWNLLGLHP